MLRGDGKNSIIHQLLFITSYTTAGKCALRATKPPNSINPNTATGGKTKSNQISYFPL